MSRKREFESDIEEGLMEHESDRVVHAEPMRATLGDKVSGVEDLREQIASDAKSEDADAARARFLRSLESLKATLRASSAEITSAIRGSAECAATWVTLEARRLGTQVSLPARAQKA